MGNYKGYQNTENSILSFQILKMMTVKINNQSKEISENISVAHLLKKLEQPEQGIAVAINQQIITKVDWTTKIINQGDHILIIQATQGG